MKRLLAEKPSQLLEDGAVIHSGQTAVIEMAEAAAAEVADAEAASHLADATREMEAAAEELGAIAAESDEAKLDAAQGHEQAAYAHLLRMRAREFQVTQASQQSASSSSSSQSKRQQQQLSNMDLKEEARYFR